MWYALLDMRNSEDTITWLAFGTLRQIADAVLEQCDFCDPFGKDTIDVDKTLAAGYYMFAEDYCALKNAEAVTSEMLDGFQFVLSDSEINVIGLSEGYDAFKKAFESYDGRNGWLESLKLPENIPKAEEPEFAKELDMILFEPEEYLRGSKKDWKYVIRVDEEL